MVIFVTIKMEILARGVGRRKEAVAQVILVKGTGNFVINNIAAQQYLHNNTYSMLLVKAPLNTLSSSNSLTVNTDTAAVDSANNTEAGNNLVNLNTGLLSSEGASDKIDTIVKVKGGGLIGQAEAIRLGLARALCCLTKNETEGIGFASEDEIRKQLKDKGYLTQDSRIKERRKYGLKKARKATQYNKR